MNTNTTLLVKMFLLIILLQSSIFGATYYVTTSGTDGGDGSQGSPWDIETGIATMDEGDTLLIAGGTYYPTISMRVHAAYIGSLPANEWTLTTTIKNLDENEVIIDGTNVMWNTLNNGVYVQGVIAIDSGRNHVVIDGLSFQNTGDGGGSIDVGMPIAVFANTHYVTVKNCKTTHTQGSGIFFSGGIGHIADNNEIYDFTYLGNHEGISAMGTESVTISNNYIHDIGNENSHNNGIAIDIKNGGSNHKIFGNTIHNTKLVGIYVDIRGGGSNIDIYNNYIYNVSGKNWPTANGIVLSDEKPEAGNIIDNVNIYNNICVGHSAKGISLGWSGIPGNPIQNANIVNNTCYGNDVGIACDTTIGAYEQANNIVIANNILTNNNTAQISTYSGINKAAYTIDSNIIIGTSTTLTAINTITNDPLFVDADNNNFRINKESPAFQAGSTKYFIPTIDFDENIRSNTNGITIGAFDVSIDTKINHFIIKKDSLIVKDQ